MINNPIEISKTHPILLFDGVCNLCNNSVQFIIERDPDAKFRFAALQSELGQQLVEELGLKNEMLQTLVLVENGKAYLRSTAALKVARKLSGFWPFFSIFIVVPSFLRDAIYNWIAKNRYRWFGQKDSCMMPTKKLRARFL